MERRLVQGLTEDHGGRALPSGAASPRPLSRLVEEGRGAKNWSAKTTRKLDVRRPQGNKAELPVTDTTDYHHLRLPTGDRLSL
jgi:hypothetical protein